MRRECPKGKRTRDRIHCTATGQVCIHQYFKQCRGVFEYTERAFTCPLKEEKK